jgi:hypothetical protein
MLVAGISLLKIIAPKLQFSMVEMLFFAIFIIVEFSYLIIQSIVQVDFTHSRSLFFYSIVRLFSIVIAFAVYLLYREVKSLSIFLLLLSSISFLGLLFSNYYFKSKTNLSIWG